MKSWLITLLLVVITMGGYSAGNKDDRNSITSASNPQIISIEAYGTDTGKGNLVGIQPYMLTTDYANQQVFYDKIDAYFKGAQAKGWFSSKTVVVLPEYLGTFLVAEDENKDVYEAATLEEAMQNIVISNPYLIAINALSSPSETQTKNAIFQMKSKAMAATYNSVFSELAQKYRVTIVAGSIILADPAVQEGRLVSRDGLLYSVSPLFTPDGKVKSLTFKSFPIVTETYIQPSPAQKLVVTDTSIGRLGVLICADSWYPQCYEIMKQKQAEVIVVPSYTQGDGMMNAVWLGCSGFPNPDDVDISDLNKITLGQAWNKYALAGRLPSSGIPNGMVVSLRGQIWDLGSDGACTVVKNGQVINMPNVNGAALVNLWL